MPAGLPPSALSLIERRLLLGGLVETLERLAVDDPAVLARGLSRELTREFGKLKSGCPIKSSIARRISTKGSRSSGAVSVNSSSSSNRVGILDGISNSKSKSR